MNEAADAHVDAEVLDRAVPQLLPDDADAADDDETSDATGEGECANERRCSSNKAAAVASRVGLFLTRSYIGHADTCDT